MANDRQVPSLGRIIQRLDRRVSMLERRLGEVIDERRTPLLFSFSGAPEEDLESPPLRPVHPTEIDLIVPQVGIAPSGGDLLIELKLNGVLIRTLTVPDGDNYVEDAVPFVIPMGSILTATVTQASGAEDLSIALIPKLL